MATVCAVLLIIIMIIIICCRRNRNDTDTEPSKPKDPNSQKYENSKDDRGIITHRKRNNPLNTFKNSSD